MECRRVYKGSLTVEAALILPLFMTGLLTLVSSLYICLLSQKIQASLHLAAQSMAISASEGRIPDTGDARDMVADSLSDSDLKFIEDGINGLDMSGSAVDGSEYLSLVVSCSFVPFSDALGIIRVPFSRKCLTHIWTGYGRGYFAGGEYVYITKDGEVYHTDKNCSHLRLSVETTSPDEVGSLRNSSGSRYRPCEHCHAHLSDKTLFVTPDGDRYHNTITCSGLKRTVYAVRKSEVPDRRPCSRCGR